MSRLFQLRFIDVDMYMMRNVEYKYDTCPFNKLIMTCVYNTI